MNELALFAGHGGGILGGKLLGWRTVCAVEYDDYARRVLMSRQDDGCLDAFPVWDDVRTFDGKPWAGLVDVVSGGFPCQDISAAGSGAGIDGARSGLWGEMARIIREVGPRFVFVENSPMLTSRGLGRVLGDLAAMGYDAAWGVLGAVHAGAPHKRDRIWIVAHAQLPERWPLGGACDGLAGPDGLPQRKESAGRARIGGANVADSAGIGRSEGRAESARQQGRLASVICGATLPDANLSGCEEQRRALADGAEHEAAECGDWWSSEPDVGRMAHGVASRVDRLRGLGNGQVPAVAALAFKTLSKRLLNNDYRIHQI